jgi:hypothetical protein
MASWRRWRAAAVVALALSLGALVHARAQAPPGAATSPPAGAPAQAEIAPVFQQLAAIRGMPAPGPPPPAVIRSRAETRRFIESELARRYSPARIEAERKSRAPASRRHAPSRRRRRRRVARRQPRPRGGAPRPGGPPARAGARGLRGRDARGHLAHAPGRSLTAPPRAR